MYLTCKFVELFVKKEKNVIFGVNLLIGII